MPTGKVKMFNRAQRVEIGNAVITANHGFAVDQEGSCPDPAGSLDNDGKSIGPIVTATRP